MPNNKGEQGEKGLMDGRGGAVSVTHAHIHTQREEYTVLAEGNQKISTDLSEDQRKERCRRGKSQGEKKVRINLGFIGGGSASVMGKSHAEAGDIKKEQGKRSARPCQTRNEKRKGKGIVDMTQGD